jgi:multidrug efflux pump subunit AcrA (membrane-fusion protein)
MKKINTLPKILVFVTLFSAVILSACSTSSSSSTASASSADSVGAVSNVTVTDSIQTSGNLDADQLANLTWKTSGIVDKVNVKVGQKVNAGDVLATLKADSVPANIATAQADLVTALRNLDDAKNSNQASAQAQLALANAQSAYLTAKNNYDALKVKRATPEMIKFAESQLTLAQNAVDHAQGAFNQVSSKAPNDPVYASAYSKLHQAQQARDSALRTLNWYKGSPTGADIATTEANLAVADANLKDAQRTWDRLKDGPDPSDIAAAQAKVDAAQATVNSMAIIAPFDGEVLGVLTSPDNLVDSGNSAVVVVNPNTLKVDALVDETDISRVAVGNTSNITMDAIPDKTLTGHVTMINPIGSSVSGLIKYTVTVNLDPTDVTPLFGATTNVDLITSAPRALLAVPLGAVQTDSTGEYVMRLASNGNAERVPVTSDSVQGDVVALSKSDLNEGDQVEVFSTTSNTSNNNRGGFGGGGLIP